MKFSVLIIASVVVSVVLGIAAGAITTKVRVSSMKEHLQLYRKVDLSEDREERRAEIKDKAGAPRYEMVNGVEHEFGTMEKDEEFSHTFIIKNTGDADGIVKLIQTSCKCTMSKKMGEDILLKPGDEEEITLSWKPVNYSAEFEQTAKIQTDDPDPEREIIELRIKGRVIQRIRPVPDRLFVSGVPTDSGFENTLRLYAYRDKDMEIVSSKFALENHRDKFDVEVRPLTEDELASEKGALAGSLVTVKNAAGLPFGPTDQELVLTTNLKGDGQVIKIPIKIIPKSEVTIKDSGRQYRFLDYKSLLEFGVVSKRNPAETTLSVFVSHGDNTPDDVEMKVLVDETYPKGGIAAEFGSPRKLGKVTIFPLKIRIPLDQKPIVLSGTEGDEVGKIVVETNLKSAKRIEIFVQYTFID